MSDETIKINREMLREAIQRAKCLPVGFDFGPIEYELFGPKKPRELYIAMKGAKPFYPLQVSTTEISCIEYNGDPPIFGSVKWVKFREVPS